MNISINRIHNHFNLGRFSKILIYHNFMRKLDAAIIVCITIAQIVEDTYSIVVYGLYDE